VAGGWLEQLHHAIMLLLVLLAVSALWPVRVRASCIGRVMVAVASGQC
jgi:hypothetical protein